MKKLMDYDKIQKKLTHQSVGPTKKFGGLQRNSFWLYDL